MTTPFVIVCVLALVFAALNAAIAVFAVRALRDSGRATAELLRSAHDSMMATSDYQIERIRAERTAPVEPPPRAPVQRRPQPQDSEFAALDNLG